MNFIPLVFSIEIQKVEFDDRILKIAMQESLGPQTKFHWIFSCRTLWLFYHYAIKILSNRKRLPVTF